MHMHTHVIMASRYDSNQFDMYDALSAHILPSYIQATAKAMSPETKLFVYPGYKSSNSICFIAVIFTIIKRFYQGSYIR